MVLPFFDNNTWRECWTLTGHNSFFHAAFGTEKNECYSDKFAESRRLNWYNFLSYYETRPKPKHLKDALLNRFRKNNWSVENDDHFREYIMHVEKDQEISPEELPVLAALENVKIIMFGHHKVAMKIIEPISELLGDYPLVNQNPITTTVIVYKKLRYCKLIPEGPKRSNEPYVVTTAKLQPTSAPSELQPKPTTTEFKPTLEGLYEKKHVSTLSDLRYKTNLLSIALLNGFRKYKTWRLSANTKDAYFDDLIFEDRQINSALMLQARWRKRDVFNKDILGDNYSGFNLVRYFFAYQQLEKKYNISSLVVCTNVQIKLELPLDAVTTRKDLVEDDLLHFKGAKGIIHTFKEGMIPLLRSRIVFFKKHVDKEYNYNLVTKNIKSFLNYFQIISLYPGEETPEQTIEKKIVDMGLCEEKDGPEYAKHFTNEIIEWYYERNEYLTPLEIKVIFSDLKSDKLLEKFRKSGIVFKPDRWRFPLTHIMLHIVPKNAPVLTLSKLSQVLASKKLGALYLSTEESTYNQKLMIDAFAAPKYLYLVVYDIGEIKGVTEIFQNITSVVDTGGKRFILIADQNNVLAQRFRRFSKWPFFVVDDNVTFSDFAEDSQGQLLEKAVLFHEASLLG